MYMKKIGLTFLLICLIGFGTFSCNLSLSQVYPLDPPSNLIYIRSNGEIDPTETPIQRSDNTYTLQENFLNHTLIIECNNVIINGANYTLSSDLSHHGININQRKNITIKNLNIERFRVGVMISDSSNINIIDNNFSANYYSIRMDYSSFNVIRGNNIRYQEGIWLYHSDNNQILNNEISNANGIKLSTSSGITILRNNLVGNDPALFLAGTSNVTYYHNNFIDNHANIIITSSKYAGVNFADNGSMGNYWSDHVYPDEDGDGIIDVPYVKDENNTDRFPLLYPYDIENDIPSTPTPAPEPEFPTTMVLVSIIVIAMIGIGVLIYFKKNKKN